ncbi:site-specific integrase [Iningainema tapete]|uniref:Tyrosine-type recombinase/integrase n=1 Tax=Iningainema tapete BLCC-T55 TaxID=2748662 RepID=A0A8J6XKD0_9CYAN|nr:site-specific integrase [Iningainema tapete]MBD2774537.1 tyrosine-type recombinase/integrase [Iningainema tapete BLCC-T55]
MKQSRGSVGIESYQGRLRLRLPRLVYEGKQKYLTVGLGDTPENRELAEEKVRQIELDIVSDDFDPTLAKYKPKTHLTVITGLKPKQEPLLNELWEKFVEYKRPQCSHNTMLHVYGHFTKYLEKLPTYDLNRANEIRDYALKTFPIDSCKRFIVRLNACCIWAMKSGLISENPFVGMACEIKLPKSQKCSEDEDILPFSVEERDYIIRAIALNSFCNKRSGFKHSYYAPYVEFMFMTGCRPSESIALEWKHISEDFKFISFEQAIIETGKGRTVREGLKTQARRRFPCNGKLQSLLQAIKSENCDLESLVFPGYRGGHLDNKSFRKNIWKPVLDGLGIEYRKPYQTRHTFITLALENGLDAKDVARLVGNSPEVIYRYYAGNKRELFVPEF